MQPILCPVHDHQRKLCSVFCQALRTELSRIGSDYRQYWHDRRRGIAPQRPIRYPRDRRPIWDAWRSA